MPNTKKSGREARKSNARTARAVADLIQAKKRHATGKLLRELHTSESRVLVAGGLMPTTTPKTKGGKSRKAKAAS